MRVIPISIKQAEEFLLKHDRHYKTGSEPICAVGVGEFTPVNVTTVASVKEEFVTGLDLHGAAILGRVGPDEAELAHIYADGTSQAYTLLYGACWRALKALGYTRTRL